MKVNRNNDMQPNKCTCLQYVIVFRTKVLHISNTATVNGSLKHVTATGQIQSLEIGVRANRSSSLPETNQNGER